MNADCCDKSNVLCLRVMNILILYVESPYVVQSMSSVKDMSMT